MLDKNYVPESGGRAQSMMSPTQRAGERRQDVVSRTVNSTLMVLELTRS